MKLDAAGILAAFKDDVVMQCEAKALAAAYNGKSPPKRIDVVEVRLAAARIASFAGLGT